MDTDASAAMETDGTMVAVGTAGSAGPSEAVVPPPPHGIDALPYADKDYDIPGAREAVRATPTSTPPPYDEKSRLPPHMSLR